MSAVACDEEETRLSGFSADGAVRQAELEDRLLGTSNALRIQDHHRELTRGPRWPGTATNKELAEYIAAQLLDSGFDSIEVHTTQVRLPIPGTRIVELTGDKPRRLALDESRYGPNSAEEYGAPAFAAFSSDGDVTGHVVYAHFGTRSDYDRLTELGIDVEGSIVMVRDAGPIAQAVAEATARGAVGVLLYPDPADRVGRHAATYPDGPERAAASATQLSLRTSTTIPVQPIPPAAAVALFDESEGPAAPDQWQGGAGVDYRLTGPEVEMRLSFERTARTVTNVIGLLLGEQHPDEWVLVGSPRDAWGEEGATAAGMATVLETARSIGRQVRRGYRPRRTVAVSSWDASAWGGVGTARWAESTSMHPRRIVAYVERTAYGPGPFVARGSHAMQPLVNAVAREIRSPTASGTVYDDWLGTAAGSERHEGTASWVDHGGWTDVRLGVTAAEGDKEALLFRLGVPTLELGYRTDDDLVGSSHDTHETFKEFGDPGFDRGERLADFTALVVTRLANADVPPLDLTATSEAIDRAIDRLEREARERGVRVGLRGLRETNASLALNAAAVNAAVDGVLKSAAPDATNRQQLTDALSEAVVLAERDLVTHAGPTAVSDESEPTPTHVLYGSASTWTGHSFFPDVHDAIRDRDRAAAQAGIDEVEARLRAVVERFRGVLERARQLGTAS